MIPLTRRDLLVLAGTLPFCAAAVADGQETFVLRGVVTNVANAPVPKGTLAIRLEEQGVMDAPARLIAATEVESAGDAETVGFEMAVERQAVEEAVVPGFTLRLERDGRLIATNTTHQGYSGGTNVSLAIEPIIY